MKIRHTIILIVLSLMLLFNLSIVYNCYLEVYKEFNLVEKKVTIIDNYSVRSSNSSVDTDYLKGQDENGDIYVIIGNEYDIGDEVYIYANTSSAEYNGGDRHWYTSAKKVQNSSKVGIVLFSLISVINLGFVIDRIARLVRPKKK